MNYLTCENCWVSANIDNDVKWVWGGLIEWFSVEWTFQYLYVEKNYRMYCGEKKKLFKDYISIFEICLSEFFARATTNNNSIQLANSSGFPNPTRESERMKIKFFRFPLTLYTRESRHFLTPKYKRMRKEKCFMASKSSKSDHVGVD